LSEIKSCDVAFVYPNYQKIDSKNKVFESIELPEFDPNEILKRGDFLATGTLYNRSIITSVGCYNENKKNCGLENYELMLTLLMNNHKGKLIKSVLFSYRFHNNNMSKTKRESIIKYGQLLATKFGLDKYQSNKNHPYGLVLE